MQICTTKQLSVSAVSASVALGVAGMWLRLLNGGNQTLHFKLGDSGVVATASNCPILKDQELMVLRSPQETHIAAITATGSSTLHITTGMGL